MGRRAKKRIGRRSKYDYRKKVVAPVQNPSTEDNQITGILLISYIKLYLKVWQNQSYPSVTEGWRFDPIYG